MQPIEWVYVVIFTAMIFSSTLWLILYMSRRDEVHSDPEPSVLPSVTFLVPAYNEEGYIQDCIDSILSVDYPEDRLEVVAVDDGSTDSTLEKLRSYGDEIKVVSKENTGKASSINTALEEVDTDVVGCLDADSTISNDFLKSMVGYFEREDVKGVTPAMRIEEPESLAEMAVWVEYVYNLFLRKLFSLFDSQFVMPGPGSLYDTDFLKEIGGWDEETLTEDMEIVFRMVENGALIKNSTNAEAVTHSPSTFSGLLRQRSRWYRGNFWNMVRYRNAIMNPRYGNFGAFILPWNLFYAGMVVFITGHLLYRMGDFVVSSLTGPVLLNLSLPGLQALSMFHMFQLAIVALGGTMLAITVKTAPDGMRFRNRKVEIGIFMAAYAFIYSMFWIKAGKDLVAGSDVGW